MSSFEVIVGDALEVLRGMPSDSVHTCVTSPPYFGLRDYGTGQWEGGDVGCDHQAPPTGGPNPERYTPGGGEMWRQANDKLYANLCGKCGARRIDNQIGLEASPEAFVAALVEVFREVRRVLRKDGTCWVNLGDSYAGSWGNYGSREGRQRLSSTEHFDRPAWDGQQGRRPAGSLPQEGLKPKDLIGIPWRVAFALQADGWWLRSDVIWSKPNPMPESVTDRPTKAHEYIFLLTKAERYFYDADAIREAAEYGRREWHGDVFATVGMNGHKGQSRVGGKNDNPEAGRNKRTVWTVATAPFSEAHFATFPPKLIEPCVLSGTSERGCCAECGAPWVRVVERSGASNGANEVIPDYKVPGLAKGTPADRVRRLSGATYRHVLRGTNQWKPTCRHTADVVPCTVLDPFCGAGTTGLVAVQHGRRFVGIELNPEYAEMARRRIHNHGAPLFSWAASNSQELTA